MSDLVHELRPAAGEPEGALVLLHGRGADERDLYDLLDLIDPKRRLVGLTPGGPLFLPPGGRHWYVVPRVGYPDPDTFQASLALLEREIPRLTGVPWERTVLGGFSQGTVMAYALGLGAGRPTPAGIVAMSGFIPTVEGWHPPTSIARASPCGSPTGSATRSSPCSSRAARATRSPRVAPM